MNRQISAIVRMLFYADVLSLLIFMVGWRFLTNTPLTTRTAITVFGLYLVLTLLRVLRSNISASASSGARAEKREFVGDPNQVLEIAKLTGYESLRRFTPYLGKWMTISGTYEGAAKALGQDSMHVSVILNDSRRINLRFAADREPEIRRLQQGQRITANCQIQHINFTFAPENGELVPAEPPGKQWSSSRDCQLGA
jgi:hypothetical protein